MQKPDLNLGQSSAFKFHKNAWVLLKETLLSLASSLIISVMRGDLDSMMAEDFLALGFSSPGEICWKQEKVQAHQGASLTRRKKPTVLGKVWPSHPTAPKGDWGIATGHWVLGGGLLLGQAHPVHLGPPWKGPQGPTTAVSISAVPGTSHLFKHPWKHLSHSGDCSYLQN